MSYEPIIELQGVWKRYSTKGVYWNTLADQISGLFKATPNHTDLKEGEFWALKGIDIAIKPGECVGLYGPNGSGKSTILKLIASVTHPNKGNVVINGKVAPLISVGAGFHPDLTGRENIFMNGAILGMSIKEIREKIMDIIEFSEIEDKFIDMAVKKYSSGMFVRLGFSVAVHSGAEILLIDELLAVGDSSFKKKCIDKIEELKNKRTMIIVLHNKRLLESITDRMIHIQKGSIVSEELINEGEELIDE